MNWRTGPPPASLDSQKCAYVDRSSSTTVPSGCQQLHLGIHMVLPTPQDFTLGGKRRKDREEEATESLGTRPSLWTGKKFFSLEFGLRNATEGAAGQQCSSSPALEQKGWQEQGALGASCDNWAEDFNSLFDQSRPNSLQLSFASGLPLSSFLWAQH